ncbi:MAG: hypothetical protein ACAH11_01420 [Sphingomonas sp.]
MALVSLAGCSPASGPVEVAALLAQCDSYLGKTVEVVGYIGECGGYSCILFADQAAAAKPFANRGAAIGVGGNEAFDAKAGPLQNSDVVITGTMDKKNCTGEGGTDRSAGLIPTDIRAWTSPGGAPGNTQ